MSEEEILTTVEFKFFELFYKTYENDNQYLRFMFIITKNIINDLQRREYRFVNKHRYDAAKICARFRIVTNDIIDDNYVRITNEMAVDNKFENNCEEKYIYQELLKQVENILERPVYIEIFHLILNDYKAKEISKIVGMSTGFIGQVKRQVIFPAIKEVLNIPDKRYEWLSASGRIYSPRRK